MTKQISALKSDTLEAGELGSCVSMLMGLDFEFLMGDCVDPSSETKRAYKYQGHSVMEDYRTAITDVVLDVIHNPSVPLLDAWFDSEEGFLAALICQVSERSQLAKMATDKSPQNDNTFPIIIDAGSFLLTLDISDRGNLSIRTVGTPLSLLIPAKMVPELMQAINEIANDPSESATIALTCGYSGDFIIRPKLTLEVSKTTGDYILLNDVNQTIFGDGLISEFAFPKNRIDVLSSALGKALGIMTNETK